LINLYTLPEQELAAGSVHAAAPPVLITTKSVFKKVYEPITLLKLALCEPVTDKVEFGFVLPMPTLPVLSITILSVLLLINLKDTLSTVPRKLLAELVSALPVTNQLLSEALSVDQKGDVAVPVFTLKILLVILKINNPFAGSKIAFCWVVVILGARKPLPVLEISSIALASGKEPSVLIAIFWALAVCTRLRNATKNKGNKFFMVLLDN
jgi:hypothetical protein